MSAGMPLDLCGIQELAVLTELQQLSLAQSQLYTSQLLPLIHLAALTHLNLSNSQVRRKPYPEREISRLKRTHVPPLHIPE